MVGGGKSSLLKVRPSKVHVEMQVNKTSNHLTSSLPETETVSDLPPKAPVTCVGRFSCVTLDVDKIAAKLEASSDYRVRKKLDLKQIRV